MNNNEVKGLTFIFAKHIESMLVKNPIEVPSMHSETLRKILELYAKIYNLLEQGVPKLLIPEDSNDNSRDKD